MSVHFTVVARADHTWALLLSELRKPLLLGMRIFRLSAPGMLQTRFGALMELPLEESLCK